MRSPRRDTTSAQKASTTTAETVSRDRLPVRPGAALLGLQRRLGNRRARGIIQAKLNVGPADDRFEREADRVSRLATGATAQRAPETVERVHGAAGGVADPGVAEAVERARGGGRPVPDGVRERMERVSGADFSGVRVHVGAESDRLNGALGSRAFTVGADVFVRRGEYRPGTASGDALLGHELTHTIQQGAALPRSSAAVSTPEVATPTVQRRFGFELELLVPMFSRKNGTEDYPAQTVGDPRIATADDGSFEVHLDHNKKLSEVLPASILWDGSAAIVELVTRPMDELTESDAQVRGVMQGLVDVARHIRTNALDRNTDIALDGLPGTTARSPGQNFVGHEVDAATPSPLTVDASVQQTYGLSLKRVGDEFAARAGTPDSERKYYNKSKKAMHKADVVGRTLLKMIKDGLVEEGRVGRYGDDEHLEEARGLLTLIAYYLLIGELPLRTPLLKNQTGLFYYKTKLSTVRNAIVGTRYPRLSAIRNAIVRPGQGLELLFTEKRARLVEWLLAATKRVASGPVFDDLEAVKTSATCAAWINSVLRGTGDLVFEQSVNRGSHELTAPDVGGGQGQGHGVVLENRRFAETEGNDYAHRYPPVEWLRLVSDLRQHLLARHGA